MNCQHCGHDYMRCTAESMRLLEQVAEYKDLAYNRAPKAMAEEANKHADELKAEIKRLRDELGYIANAKSANFEDAEEFRAWAQNRARHALGLKMELAKDGTLTVKK